MIKTPTKNEARLVDLREGLFVSTDLTEKHDPANNVLRGVKLLGAKSKNGRRYSPKAIGEAAALYEGVQVNVDHPEQRNASKERGLLESWGEVRNVTHDGQSVHGDVHYLESHVATPVVLERLGKRMKMGMSHNARAKTAAVNGESVVESVHLVRSIDLVLNPATTENLWECVEVTEENTLATKLAALLGGSDATEEVLLESVTKLIAGQVTESTAPTDSTGGPTDETTNLIESLQERIDTLEQTEGLRQFCRKQGGQYDVLSNIHRELLESCSEDNREALFKSWPGSVTGKQKPPVGGVSNVTEEVAKDAPGSQPLSMGRSNI